MKSIGIVFDGGFQASSKRGHSQFERIAKAAGNTGMRLNPHNTRGYDSIRFRFVRQS